MLTYKRMKKFNINTFEQIDHSYQYNECVIDMVLENDNIIILKYDNLQDEH